MRLTYDEIIQQKNFYRNSYRRLIKLLVFSLCLNALMALLCFYFKMTEPESDYYASHPFGVVKLTGRATANFGSQPLLAPDPPEEAGQKILEVD